MLFELLTYIALIAAVLEPLAPYEWQLSKITFDEFVLTENDEPLTAAPAPPKSRHFENVCPEHVRVPMAAFDVLVHWLL
jgi:hypothetical protein